MQILRAFGTQLICDVIKKLMRKLYSPENDAELALIKSIFDGENIQYFVHNDHFGSLEVGPKIDLFNAKTIMVSDHQYELASDILRDIVLNSKLADEENKTDYTLIDKIRMIIETLLFTWFMPGKFRRKKSE